MTTLLRHSEGFRGRFDIRLALLDREPSAYSVPDWVRVHDLDCRFRLGASLRQLGALARQIDPDCMVSFLTRANVANAWVSAKRGTPAIISERINTGAQLGAGLRGVVTRRIVRFTYPKASRVIGVSLGVGEALARDYGVERSRIDVIANPVDIDEIRARASDETPDVPEDPYTFAMGRLVPKKNFALLLRAFARAGLPGRLVIAGEGPERDALLELGRELGLADRVLLPGFVANPYPLLSRARTFVLSSNAEGFPNALVEAMSLGIPAIATNCADGPAEILAGVRREEVSGSVEAPAGLLVPVDDPQAMSEALIKVQDSELRNKLASAGRRRAEGFTVESSVKRYWEVIEGALGEPLDASGS